MDIQISFSESLSYADDVEGISLPVVLSFGGRSREVYAKVDTGAAVCLFKREIGEQLGVDVDRGIPIRLGSLAGPIDAFGHEVVLQTGQLVFDTTVYFAKYPGLRGNFLGRQGWIRNIRLGLVDYENMICWSKYE